MGNKCCSKRQSDDFATAGYKVEPNPGINKIPNPMDPRYTPDPRPGVVIKPPGGIDFIRAGGPRRK